MSRIALHAAAVCLLWLPAIAADTSEDLLEAARKGRRDQVEALLNKGAALEARDKEGRTPLMLAAQYGRGSTVQLLLAKGANAEARDSRGWNTYMLALMAPSGGVVHTSHDAVLKLLPRPARLRLAVEAAWTPAKAGFSSCFMRPEQLAQHIRDIRPDAIVVEALERYAATAGRDLIAVVHADVRGMSGIDEAGAPADAAHGVLILRVEPAASCVQQSDQLSLLIHARVLRKQNPSPVLEREFGGGIKTGMREQVAANPNQYAPLYQAWAK